MFVCHVLVPRSSSISRLFCPNFHTILSFIKPSSSLPLFLSLSLSLSLVVYIPVRRYCDMMIMFRSFDCVDSGARRLPSPLCVLLFSQSIFSFLQSHICITHFRFSLSLSLSLFLYRNARLLSSIMFCWDRSNQTPS